MNVTEFPAITDDALDVALAALREAGIGFTVVCEGPEATCGDVPAAA